MSLVSQNPMQTNAWKKLVLHFNNIQSKRIDALFNENPNRNKELSIELNNLLLDFSKNKITLETIALFEELAQECSLKENILSLTKGDLVNETEKRAVLHLALRNSKPNTYFIGGKNIDANVQNVLQQMKNFCNHIHQGKHLGYDGKKIKYIVNIGIGGSDLGPLMACEALKPFWIKGIETFFVSNIDAAHIKEVFQKITPQETLFIIASKTFTTQETITNAQTARKWFLSYAKNEEYIKNHFVALSTNASEVQKFGIDLNNMFEFWDWVGGRYSLWSAIGLSIALTIGFDNFEKILQGAEEMDNHCLQTPFSKNIPFILAIIGIWHRNFFNYQSHCIMPYNQYLQKFPAYLQQTDMESNGKYIDRNGNQIDYQTAPIIWGDAGTNGQHSFFQLLHQGTNIVPCDFIASVRSPHQISDHQEKLLSNCIAQSAALMKGKSKEHVTQEMKQKNSSQADIDFIVNYKTFLGDRPSTTLLFKEINPFALGQLIALYEHKIMIQGMFWNIFSYDQFGVELGKEMCNQILPKLQDEKSVEEYDSSTNALINYFNCNK